MALGRVSAGTKLSNTNKRRAKIKSNDGIELYRDNGCQQQQSVKKNSGLYVTERGPVGT